MTQSRTVNTEALKREHVGVELEMSNMPQPTALKILCEHFGRNYPVDVHEGNHLHERYILDDNGRKWSTVTDASIYGTGCELVSPVLNYEDIEDYQALVRKFRVAGARSSARLMCGVHIHVDFRGHTPETLRRLQNVVSHYEALVSDSVDVSAERYRFTQASEGAWLMALNEYKPRDMESFKRLWYGIHHGHGGPCGSTCAQSYADDHYDSSRYHLVNFHAIWQHKTIEFRCFEFHKGIHAGELKAWMQWAMAVNAYAKTISRAPSWAPVRTTNPKFTFRNWLLNMGLVGDEFKTCRKHWLKRLSGDTAYRNGRPVNRDDLDDSFIDSPFVSEA